MSALTETDFLRAYATMINTRSADNFLSLLPEDFVYESQNMFSAFDGKEAFTKYISTQLRLMREKDEQIFAELATIQDRARNRPCVVMARFNKDYLIGVLLADVVAGKLVRMDFCSVAPLPEKAVRTGDYPR